LHSFFPAQHAFDPLELETAPDFPELFDSAEADPVPDCEQAAANAVREEMAAR